QTKQTPLPHTQSLDFSRLKFKDMWGESLVWDDYLQASYTDGIVVLHKGRIVYEKYLNALKETGLHACFSVTKSVFGLLALDMIYHRLLDPTQRVTHYVPELANSAFATATVQQVLDMQTSLNYTEVYSDPESGIWKYMRSSAIWPQKDFDASNSLGIYHYLTTVQAAGRHGEKFTYLTVNTDVLAWIMQRITSTAMPQMISEKLWQPLGCEQDARISLDIAGNVFAGGGLLTCTRDLARLGLMLSQQGAMGHEQIIPPAVVAEIEQGNDVDKFTPAGYSTLPGCSYRAMWWVAPIEEGWYMARGVYGQALFIHPKAQVVIARFGSHRLAANTNSDPINLPAYLAVVQSLSS
ncbi:MAG: serine hydrolase domain-containing protein, partial [Gammaproteobacteria bacterium]|nr:serine hydrolase domain-containing protein [Gammaproteobacteria bacterium]